MDGRSDWTRPLPKAELAPETGTRRIRPRCEPGLTCQVTCYA